ncbi:MAG: hypothetical protein K6B14_04820 [Lachnospiraceae bacterium]|nr:hypothetical protein [Lachnospiraceae bacterium]
MITLFFCMMILAFVAGAISLAVKLTWSLTKVIFSIVGTVIVAALLLSGGFVVAAFLVFIFAGVGGILAAVSA